MTLTSGVWFYTLASRQMFFVLNFLWFSNLPFPSDFQRVIWSLIQLFLQSASDPCLSQRSLLDIHGNPCIAAYLSYPCIMRVCSAVLCPEILLVFGVCNFDIWISVFLQIGAGFNKWMRTSKSIPGPQSLAYRAVGDIYIQSYFSLVYHFNIMSPNI